MTVTGHLKELRNRLAIWIVGLVIAFMIALYFSQDIIDLLIGMGQRTITILSILRRKSS